jgi:hypothetical protein
MPRSIFGWDLPPGCTQRDIDEAAGGNRDICTECGVVLQSEEEWEVGLCMKCQEKENEKE